MLVVVLLSLIACPNDVDVVVITTSAFTNHDPRVRLTNSTWPYMGCKTMTTSSTSSYHSFVVVLQVQFISS